MKNPYAKNTQLSNVFGYLTLNTDKQPMPLADVAEALQMRYSSLYNATVRDRLVGKIQCQPHDGKLCVALPGFVFPELNQAKESKPVAQPAKAKPTTPTNKKPAKPEPEIMTKHIDQPPTYQEVTEKLDHGGVITLISEGTDRPQNRVSWDNIDGITIEGPDGTVQLDQYAINTLKELFEFHEKVGRKEIRIG